MVKIARIAIFLLVGLAAAAQTGAEHAPVENLPNGRLALHHGWQMQSSCKMKATGDAISTTAFSPDGWHAAVVPGGVLANLVADKVLPDPNYGMNLRDIPGATYPIGTIFANQPMPEGSPFKCSWWYRTEFTVPATWRGRNLWLHFDGINYRANIWINGKQVARANPGDSASGLDDLAHGAVVAGAWRLYEFNAGEFLQAGKPNELAVEVFAPTEMDLGINWVDWNPAPPDKNMGLWRDVYLTSSGPVAVRNPQATAQLYPGQEKADLTLRVEVRNASSQPIRGLVRATIIPPHPGGLGGGYFSVQQEIALDAHETREVVFSPDQFAQLQLKDAKLWWPADLGPQNLYDGSFEFFPVEADGAAGPSSDRTWYRFGIREVTSELTPEGNRLFKINGRNILIRGAGWTPDLLLNSSDERIEQQLRYVRHMHLNAVRLEGKLESDHFFDEADRLGILVMAGWCCCDHWERWDSWTPADHVIASESLRSQILRLRNHPSVFVWLNGSDNPPPPPVERDYLAVLQQLHWPNPVLSSATALHTVVSGASGVKMTGPYDWVPPSYWYEDFERGGAHGFNTETGPGPAIPPVDSLRKFLPKEHLWPIDFWWNYHAGGGMFKTLNIFSEAMSVRYGPADSLEDFERKAQAMSYDGQRAMFEAYRRNKYRSTGVIQWMLNNAWPSLIWHLYDWYLMPAAGYFATRSANEPLHVQYAYDDNAVYVVNSLPRAFARMKVEAEVYDFAMRPRFSRQRQLDIPEDGSMLALVLPSPEELSPVYFLRLRLLDAEGKEVSRNLYWLTTRRDALDWEHATWYTTPLTQHADYTQLVDLPMVNLHVAAATTGTHRGEETTRVTVQNPSRHLAFMVRLRVTDAEGNDILPVLWEDNYFSLLPGERREVSAQYDAKGVHGPAVVHVEGWNITPKSERAASPPAASKAAE